MVSVGYGVVGSLQAAVQPIGKTVENEAESELVVTQKEFER